MGFDSKSFIYTGATSENIKNRLDDTDMSTYNKVSQTSFHFPDLSSGLASRTLTPNHRIMLRFYILLSL